MSMSSRHTTVTTSRGDLESHSGASGIHYEGQQVFKNFTDDNVCGKTLLTIVARGNAIITELIRLTELVPAPYKQSAYDSHYVQQLDRNKKPIVDNLICDFSYFKNADKFEARIEADAVLKRADENFCDNYIEILTRFYLTFESVYRYATDLNNFIIELEDEMFVGQTIDGLLADFEARQLLCEAYYLLGYMLMATDENFEGSLRERLIVSYYRYSSYKSSPDSNVDNTCNLMRTTGFRCRQQQIYRTSGVVQYHRPDGYPESFFDRAGVNQSIVNLLISKLQSVDIYNQTVVAYPHPDHRSVAMSQQASMLYVLLYFCPNILSSQRARMREISDKFFCDNWIISVYMGELVNLIEAWEPYKAAKESLGQLFEFETVRNLVNHNTVIFYRQSKQLQEYLRDGWLSDDTVIENHTKILNTIRSSNVVLRWILLHSQTLPSWHLRLSKLAHSAVDKSQLDRKVLYKFLQNLAELEKNFSSLCDKILAAKSSLIYESKSKAVEILEDLVSIFSDTRPMRWMQAGTNTKLAELLSALCHRLNSTVFEHQNARDLVIKLIGDIDSTKDSYTDGKSLQVAQLFTQVKGNLLKILKLIALKYDVKLVLQTVSDFSYAWRLMDATFTNHIQQVIQEEPAKVYGIKSILLKLSSSFDAQLIRIQQINAEADLVSVSQYYSTKLVYYIRDVLQVIPSSILELVSKVISIQTDSVIGDMPAKVTLDSLRDYSLPDERFRMSELTNKISNYAESLLMMQNTTIGLIRIDSKQILEDGIRRELAKRMSDSIQNTLQFSESTHNLGADPLTSAKNLMAKLERLDYVMQGHRRSFEYIQDYLFIYGLRIEQEELSRLIKFNVELATYALEVGTNLDGDNHSILEHQSLYQSSKAPIPIYGPNIMQSSFILRIFDELLRVTEPRATIYDEQMSAWYEQSAEHQRVLDLKVFELIGSSLSVAGLNGLDQLCCTQLMFELQKLDAHLVELVVGTQRCQNLVESLETIRGWRNQCLEEPATTSSSKQQVARQISSALAKMAPLSDTIVNYLLRIGQLQAIRSCISCVVTTKCRYEARNLHNCLKTLNTSLLSALKRGSKKSSQQKASRGRDQADAEDKNGGQLMAAITSQQQEPLEQKQCATLLGNKDATAAEGDDDVGADRDGNGSEIVGNLEESQLIFELANHLEWIGLSDPLNKVYTLLLQASGSSRVFEFSGFLPKQSRSFYETSCTVDGQPLFYGIATLTKHYQPMLGEARPPAGDEFVANCGPNAPVGRLLELMGLYAKCFLDQPQLGTTIKPNELTLEVANIILSMIELIRLARKSSKDLLSNNCLPKFLLDTFQFTICHLNSGANVNKT